MVDEADSKSVASDGVWVRVPPPAPEKGHPKGCPFSGGQPSAGKDSLRSIWQEGKPIHPIKVDTRFGFELPRDTTSEFAPHGSKMAIANAVAISSSVLRGSSLPNQTRFTVLRFGYQFGFGLPGAPGQNKAIITTSELVVCSDPIRVITC